MAISVRFQIGGHDAAAWTGGNPVLLDREYAAEEDTGKFKLGDGSTAWNSLPYITFWSSFARLDGAVGDNAALAAALSGKQGSDALLTSIAGLTFGADSYIYGTGSDTAAAGTITAFGRDLVDSADASAARTTLGLGTAAVKNTGTSGDAVPVLNGAAATWAAGATFGGDLQINNATYLRGKIAAGTTTRMLGINGSDVCFVGSVDAAVASITFVGSGTFATMTSTGLNLPTGSVFRINNVQLVTSRRTGWTAATGTPTRTTFDTTTVTLPQLAERVKALIDDLITHGLIGT